MWTWYVYACFTMNNFPWTSVTASFYFDAHSRSSIVWQEDGIDLVTIIKGTSFYRRGKYHDYVSDFKPPTPSEFKKIYESHR